MIIRNIIITLFIIMKRYNNSLAWRQSSLNCKVVSNRQQKTRHFHRTLYYTIGVVNFWSIIQP